MVNISSVSSYLQPASGPANPYNSAPISLFTNVMISGGTGYMLSKKAFVTDGLSLSNPAGPQSVQIALLKHSLASSAGAGLFYGILGAVKQFGAVQAGAQDTRGAWANITADTLQGVSTGLGAGAFGSLSALGMRAMGATGLIGTAVTVVGGVVGGLMGQAVFTSTGAREKLLTSFGSQKTGPLPQTSY